MSQKVFEFKDLFLEVKNEDKNISTEYAKLLDGVSGKFVSGELTAVMGASGAGKSTLFNMLLGRISNDCKSYGTILYNGKERSAYDWVHQVAYLKQEDIFYTKFSILECILYNLDFYQPFTSKKEKLSLAEDLLRRSNIFEKRHAYMESLSGGERKRAMIALSMCSDPEIIFMDEPTSGLDSHSALTLINFMKTYAKENDKIVVISLHQPGEALFNLFENILYLGKGGVFYDGKIKDIPDWLNANKIPKPEGISLAEFLFELHTDNPHLPEISRFRSNVDQIINSNRQKYDELRRSNVLVGNLSSRYFEMSFSFADVITFIRRFYLNVYRTERFLLGMVIQILIFLFVVGFLYFGTCIVVTQDLRKLSPSSDSIKELVDYAKSYFTSDMKRFFSDNLFLTFLVAAINYVFYIKNTCNNQIQILEDIYSAKYTVLTCFLGYFLHDFFVTTFWFAFAYGVVLFSGFLPLINYWYLIYIFSAILCFTINYIFMKNLFGFSKNSKILNSIMFGVGLFTAAPMLLEGLIGKLQALAPGNEEKTKYIGCIFTIFPQMLLKALTNYKNIESIQAHKGDVKDNKIYLPKDYYVYLIELKPKSQFRVLGLDDASYSVVFLIFVVSLFVNFFGALYLFNKHVNAELRLKMK